MSAFTASKSAIASETLVEYLNTFNPAIRDLETVPGVGPAARAAFEEAGTKSVQGLLGRLLLCCDQENTCHEAYEAFYQHVHEIAPRANAHTITFAMASLADHMGLLTWEDEL